MVWLHARWAIVAGMKRWTVLGACVVALAGMLTSSACQNMPGPFAPPVQRQPLADFRPYRISGIVNMSDADAQTRFVQDITGLQAATWRWTGKRPTVRVMTRSTENLKYTIDFAIVEATLATTGPVTVTFLVNDRKHAPALRSRTQNVVRFFNRDRQRLLANHMKSGLERTDRQCAVLPVWRRDHDCIDFAALH